MRAEHSFGRGRRPAAFATLACLLATVAPQPTLAQDPAAIHRQALTLDSHVDIPFDYATPAVDPLDANLQVNLQKMRAGGLDAAFFIVYVGQTARTAENYVQAQVDAMTKFNAIHRMTEELYPQRIELARTPGDVERAVGDGRLAAAIGIENGYVIGTDLSLIERYHALGARYVTLVHNGHNDIADSATPRPEFGDETSEHDGVSDFGARVIAKMNRVGILVDISHASKAAALDAIRLSQAPVIASHSSVRALADHRRNLDDETLRALRANGGVVQIVAFDGYLKVQPAARDAAIETLRAELDMGEEDGPELLSDSRRAEYERQLRQIDTRWPPADVGDLVDHVDYAVELIGIDHVGISSDFDGGGGIEGWRDASETAGVTAELVRRGYSRQQIGQLWSANLMRVWNEAAEVAAATR